MIRTFAYTLLALTAFAANSLLCRMALTTDVDGNATIDAASFTLFRLLAGALFLAIVAPLIGAKPIREIAQMGSWKAALYLFIYAAGFSFAYTNLDTGTGALILFGSVQLSMFAINVHRGVKVTAGEWLGMALAMGGLGYMLAPQAGAPDPLGFVLMAIAGIAWGLYTLAGLGQSDPTANTAANFIRATAFLPLLAVPLLLNPYWSATGIWLAVASGALASGAGYTLWYLALATLKPTHAAVSQLSVPVLAAVAGLIVLSESPTQALYIGSALVLCGLGTALVMKRR